MASLNSRITPVQLVILVSIFSSFSLVNATAIEDLKILRKLENLLDACQASILNLQELITQATPTTTAIPTLTTHILTSEFPLKTKSINMTASFDMEETSFTTESFQSTESLEFFNTTDVEEPTYEPEMLPSNETDDKVFMSNDSDHSSSPSRSTTSIPTTSVVTTVLTVASSNSNNHILRKRNSENNSVSSQPASKPDDYDRINWDREVELAILMLNTILHNITIDPYEEQFADEIDQNTKLINKLTKLGENDSDIILESNLVPLQLSLAMSLNNLFDCRKVLKREVKRVTSTRMGTTAVICLVSILLAFVIIALVCVFMKPWKRFCKKKDDTSVSSRSSSTTYSKYYRKASALDGFGIRNPSYQGSREHISIPSISIPRPTVIQLSDRYQPSTNTLQNYPSRSAELPYRTNTLQNYPSRSAEPSHRLPRSYISYT